MIVGINLFVECVEWEL